MGGGDAIGDFARSTVWGAKAIEVMGALGAASGTGAGAGELTWGTGAAWIGGGAAMVTGLGFLAGPRSASRVANESASAEGQSEDQGTHRDLVAPSSATSLPSWPTPRPRLHRSSSGGAPPHPRARLTPAPYGHGQRCPGGPVGGPPPPRTSCSSPWAR